MKAFAQFWHMSTGYVAGTIPPVFSDSYKRPIEACGSGAVLVLDGRLNLDNMRLAAKDAAKSRGYIGYSIHRGDFRNSRELVGYTPV